MQHHITCSWCNCIFKGTDSSLRSEIQVWFIIGQPMYNCLNFIIVCELNIQPLFLWGKGLKILSTPLLVQHRTKKAILMATHNTFASVSLPCIPWLSPCDSAHVIQAKHTSNGWMRQAPCWLPGSAFERASQWRSYHWLGGWANMVLIWPHEHSALKGERVASSTTENSFWFDIRGFGLPCTISPRIKLLYKVWAS